MQIVADRECAHEGSIEQNQGTLSLDQETLFILGPVNLSSGPWRLALIFLLLFSEILYSLLSFIAVNRVILLFILLFNYLYSKSYFILHRII